VRAYLDRCRIEGDVDFVFGQAAAFFRRCELRSLGSRAAQSWVTAPSTHIRARYGFVFDDCDFTHDDSAAARRGRFLLGRQWFEGVRATPYGASPVEGFRCRLGPVSEFAPPDGAISRATLEAVGKCVVLNSRIGPHINPAAPWGEWNGGEWSREGSYRPAPWHPRFRPVQARPGDFPRRARALAPRAGARLRRPRCVGGVARRASERLGGRRVTSGTAAGMELQKEELEWASVAYLRPDWPLPS
jgi:pectinesterase